MTAFFAGVGHGYIAPLGLGRCHGGRLAGPRRPRLGSVVPVGGAGHPRGGGRRRGRAGRSGGIAMVVLAAAVGIVATVAWWERADQTG